MKIITRLLCLAMYCIVFSTQTYAGAFVHLFEWQWTDIASECEDVLGPKGYAAVQVSPPQESIDGDEWWTRYQPVSYEIAGRSGTREEFSDMVDRCEAVGVGIYVDAVINHMAAWNRDFPNVPYSPDDFHSCTADIDYSNSWSIQNCDLVGLNDLETESDYVRGKIADYMNDLIGLGVAGFRIDAAKHIPAEDISNIVSRLNGSPYIFQEVIGASGEAVQPDEYTYIGAVTEFNFTDTIGWYFKGNGTLSDIQNIGSWDGWLSSNSAVTFVANHDNQRQDTDNIITHFDGEGVNNNAHVFTLAWPYGYPKVMSSYDWDYSDQGPPSVGASTCSNGWLCEHRNQEIANMVAFRNATDGENEITNWWDNNSQQIAFGRGSLGFVVINNEDYALTRAFETSLPAGTYCDIVNGDYSDDSCSGTTITVNDSGEATIAVNANGAVAIYIDAVVTSDPDDTISFTCNNGYTYLGQSVYVVGDISELGNWAPESAVKLDPSNYPTWTGNITLPTDTDVEWKCMKRDEDDTSAAIEWESGSNNSLNTSTGTSAQSSF